MKITLNQEIKIAGETFRALNIMTDRVYFAKVLKSGKLASINSGNHGTYTNAQIEEYTKIGAFII